MDLQSDASASSGTCFTNGSLVTTRCAGKLHPYESNQQQDSFRNTPVTQSCLNAQSNFLPSALQRLLYHVVNYLKNKYTGCHRGLNAHLAELIKHSNGL